MVAIATRTVGSRTVGTRTVGTRTVAIPAPPPAGPRRPRPDLRVVEGGRAPARRAAHARHLRRRLVVLAVAVLLVTGVVWLASAAVAGPTPPGPAAASGAAGPAADYVVQPGDTLWSIAGRIDPGTDVRVTVDRLVALNGAAPLVVGQRLELP
jgi:LysM repeat protein